MNTPEIDELQSLRAENAALRLSAIRLNAQLSRVQNELEGVRNQLENERANPSSQRNQLIAWIKGQITAVKRANASALFALDDDGHQARKARMTAYESVLKYLKAE